MKMENDIRTTRDGSDMKEKETGNNLKNNKRKREEEKVSSGHMMWNRMKTVQKRQKAALKEVMMKNKEKLEEVVRVERWMLDQLDKECEEKMAAFVKELDEQKQEKTLEIAEKVKVKNERQWQQNQKVLDDLAKEHEAEELQVLKEFWKKADEEEEEVVEENNHVERKRSAHTVPPAPDCPICYESMYPPVR